MTTQDVEWPKRKVYKRDPLPKIAPALLNSHDIAQYVERGCLLEATNFKPKRLKPASYEMRFLGTLYDWKLKNGVRKKRCREITEDQYVKIGKNSISYLWMQERLYLPEYIAARFNLRIGAVHKGILLGTGPLIDPGFGGRLLIPLHNLTDNDYALRGGEGIIWVEFTKVSNHRYWLQDTKERKRPAELVEFPSDRVMDDPNDYFTKARAEQGVQSAFRGALDDARSAAIAARKTAEEIDKRSMRVGVVGLLGVAVGLTAVVLSALVLVFSAFVLVFSSYDIHGRVADRLHGQGGRIQALEKKLEELRTDSNVSGGAEEVGVPGPSDLGGEEAASP